MFVTRESLPMTPESQIRAPSATPVDDAVLPFEVAALDVRGRLTKMGPALDEILTKAIGASGEERQRLYGQAQAEIIGQAYAVPLYVVAYQLGASKKLQGVSWATNAKPNLYDAWLAR